MRGKGVFNRSHIHLKNTPHFPPSTLYFFLKSSSSTRTFSNGREKTPWESLGLKPGASKDEIKDAYINLAKLHHPDSSGSDSSAKFIEISKAYESIKDEEGRGNEIQKLNEVMDRQQKTVFTPDYPRSGASDRQKILETSLINSIEEIFADFQTQDKSSKKVAEIKEILFRTFKDKVRKFGEENPKAHFVNDNSFWKPLQIEIRQQLVIWWTRYNSEKDNNNYQAYNSSAFNRNPYQNFKNQTSKNPYNYNMEAELKKEKEWEEKERQVGESFKTSLKQFQWGFLKFASGFAVIIFLVKSLFF